MSASRPGRSRRRLAVLCATLAWGGGPGWWVLASCGSDSDLQQAQSLGQTDGDTVDTQDLEAVFVVQPDRAVAGARWGQQAVVEVRDRSGARLGDRVAQPWVRFALVPDEGDLYGDVVVRAVAGRATPSDQAAQVPGQYRLRALVVGPTAAASLGGEAYSQPLTVLDPNQAGGQPAN